VCGEGIGDVSADVNVLVTPVRRAATSALSVSVSVSVSEWEREMEEGRPVARKIQTDSRSPSLSLKRTHLGPGGGERLAGECVRGVVCPEMTLRPREHLREDF
jgi:hypothetical protein